MHYTAGKNPETIVFLVFPQNVELMNQKKTDIMHCGHNGNRMATIQSFTTLPAFMLNCNTIFPGSSPSVVKEKAILVESCNNTSAQDI